MKISNINIYKFNSNNLQINSQSKEKEKIKYTQTNNFPNYCYIPFCGKKTESNPIKNLLKTDTFDKDKKQYLKFLTTIEGFSQAASGLDEEQLRKFVSMCLAFSPCSEDILLGNYTAVFGDIEKPLVDLKSIATYNRKHPETPINLNQELFENPIAIRLMEELKRRELKGFAGTAQMGYIENDDLLLRTTIKYSIKQPSLKDLEKIKNAPLNKATIDLFKFKSFAPEYKQTLWELTEIPYFNAATQNLSISELQALVEIATPNKALFTETLKGNIYSYNKNTNSKAPVVNLKDFALYNLTHSKRNQVSLLISLLDNPFFVNIANCINSWKNYENKYPSFLYTDYSDNKKELKSYFADNKEEAMAAFIGLSGKLTNFNDFVIFENDLNEIAAKTDREEEETEEDIILEKLVEERRNYETPQVVLDYLKDFKIDNNLKKIVYDFAEEIPYFNYLMRDASMDDLNVLVELKNGNPKIFNMLMDGKIKLITDEFFGECILPMIDVEEMVRKEGKLSSVIYRNSMAFDLTRFISEINKKLDISSGVFLIDINSTDCKSILNYMKENNTDKIKISIEE